MFFQPYNKNYSTPKSHKYGKNGSVSSTDKMLTKTCVINFYTPLFMITVLHYSLPAMYAMYFLIYSMYNSVNRLKVRNFGTVRYRYGTPYRTLRYFS